MVRIRERVDMSQVPSNDGTRLVGRLGAGRPPARLMVIRNGRRLLLLLRLLLLRLLLWLLLLLLLLLQLLLRLLQLFLQQLLLVLVDSATASVGVGHVHGRLGSGRAQGKIRLRMFGERRFGRTDLAGRVGTTKRPHGTAVRRHAAAGPSNRWRWTSKRFGGRRCHHRRCGCRHRRRQHGLHSTYHPDPDGADDSGTEIFSGTRGSGKDGIRKKYLGLYTVTVTTMTVKRWYEKKKSRGSETRGGGYRGPAAAGVVSGQRATRVRPGASQLSRIESFGALNAAQRVY